MAEAFSFGVDLSLTRGAVVQVHFTAPSFQDELCISDLTKVSSWSRGPGVKATLTDYNLFLARQITQPIAALFPKDGEAAVPIGIDWTPAEIFWRSSKRMGVMKAYCSGYLHRQLRGLSLYPAFVSPQVVRAIMGLKSNAKKGVVHERFEAILPEVLLKRFYSWNEHLRDAAILGLAVRRFMERSPGEVLWRKAPLSIASSFSSHDTE